MNSLCFKAGLLLMLVLATCPPTAAHAIESNCDDAQLLEQTFTSGASWTLCIAVDEQHAIDISSIHYRAPGDSLRSVLERIHVGQILLHYHDETKPRAQIGPVENGRLLSVNERNCDGALLLDQGEGSKLCSRVEDNRTSAKYAQRPSLQSQRWELSAVLQREGLVWAISITLDEDGRITPGVSLSGRAREIPDNPAHAASLPGNDKQLARASILTTWRLVFNLDDGTVDTVQQFDFPINVAAGNRRAMQVKNLDIETFVLVERGKFRGWRVSDAGGAGYFLDPFNSGFSFLGSNYNWAKFDLALTRYSACERYALGNVLADEASNTCGNSLDDFVNGETLSDAHPVLWFSQSRTHNPSDEDWPVISNLSQSFTLMPYDWTPSSPFELSK